MLKGKEETGGHYYKKISYLNILDVFMQKENFYQKILEANKILKMFYEAHMIFNFTFSLTKNRDF
jgi:hypothetical protein